MDEDKIAPFVSRIFAALSMEKKISSYLEIGVDEGMSLIACLRTLRPTRDSSMRYLGRYIWW